MQNQSILTIFTIFLLLALVSGHDNRKSRRRQLMAGMGPKMGVKKEMETMFTDDQEEEWCIEKCEEQWADDPDKIPACQAECEELGERRDRRELKPGKVMKDMETMYTDDQEEDWCIDKCAQKWVSKPDKIPACQAECEDLGGRRNRRQLKPDKPMKEMMGDGDDSEGAEIARCEAKCTKRWGGTEKEGPCITECTDTGGRRRLRLR